MGLANIFGIPHKISAKCHQNLCSFIAICPIYPATFAAAENFAAVSQSRRISPHRLSHSPSAAAFPTSTHCQAGNALRFPAPNLGINIKYAFRPGLCTKEICSYKSFSIMPILCSTRIFRPENSRTL